LTTTLTHMARINISGLMVPYYGSSAQAARVTAIEAFIDHYGYAPIGHKVIISEVAPDADAGAPTRCMRHGMLDCMSCV